MAVYLELLDLVSSVGFRGDENGYDEHLSAGVQFAERVFHVGPGGLVRDVEGARGVSVEKGLDDLAGLGPGTVAGGRDDGDLEVVGEPGGQAGGVSLGDIFADGDKDIIALVLCEKPCNG